MAKFSALSDVFPAFDVRGSAPRDIGTKMGEMHGSFRKFLASDGQDNARKRAMLLHYAGVQVYDIFVTLPDRGDAKDFNKASKALTAYFSPKKNVDFEVYKFRQSTQSENETVGEYYSMSVYAH